MPETNIVLINPLGLHARAAAKLVDVAKQYASEITIHFGGRDVDAKSIMALLMLGAAVDSELTLRINGEDEDAAMDAVTELINAGFYELDES